MKPVSPVLPGYSVQETVFTSKDANVEPLPGAIVDDGTVLIRWQPSEEDRRRLLNGEDIYLWIHTYGQPLQPVLLEVKTADEVMKGADTSEAQVDEKWDDVIDA